MELFDLNASQKTKSTPAGEIPVDWGVACLGDVATIKSGGTPDRGISAYWNGDIPWVKTGEINFNIIHVVSERITQLGLKESSARIVPKGTVLMAMYGQGKTRGQVAILGIDAAINQACAAIQVYKDRLDKSYLFFNLEFRYDEIRDLSNTGSQENLNAQVIRTLRIALPPITEQIKIASLLLTWDEALEKLNILIRAKEQRKNVFMQQFLTSASARAGTTHARHRIGDVCERVTRKNVELDDNVLTISGQDGLVNQKEYFTRGIASADSSGYYLLQQGEFAYNRSTSKGYPLGAIKRLDRYKKGVVSTLYLCFRIKSIDTTSSSYLCHYFESGRFNSALRSIAKEGARAHGLLNVSTEEFFDLDIFLPSISEQQKIADILDTCDEEIRLLRAQNAALEQQKRGLMQRLLTGKIRVKPDHPTN